jgi:MAF protein
LIKLTGWDSIAISTDVIEEQLPNEPASEYVMRLALDKSYAVRQDSRAEYSFTADTIVVDNETIYGKPKDAEDAHRMLKALRGHSHIVMTAIALYARDTQLMETDLCKSIVPMREYSDNDLETYIASGDGMDKAGAYAIQNSSFHPVVQFTGCFASVMGLPLCHLARTAQKLNLTPLPGLPSRCQAALGYECNIHDAILCGDIIG